MRFEEVEHTADLSIRAYGATLEELFANAALGMFSLVFDVDTAPAPSVERTIDLPADEPARLLRKWLAELLHAHESEGLLFSEFEVSLSGDGLRGVARGVPCHEVEGCPVAPIKAVTYHGLEVVSDDERLSVAVVFDT